MVLKAARPVEINEGKSVDGVEDKRVQLSEP